MKCENCGNEHDGSYGSGRFCSLHCRKSFIAKKVKNRSHARHNTSPYGTWKCKYCLEVFLTRKSLKDHMHKFHKHECIHCGQKFDKSCQLGSHVIHCKKNPKYQEIKNTISSKISVAFIGKTLSDNHKKKISNSMKKFFNDHPDRVPYLLNHSSKESYPEQYFRTAFQNENFPSFVQDKYVEGYFLDFAFENSKQYIEVDGEQHYTDQKIVEHDKIRYEILNKTEWKCICRIRWSKFQKLTNDQKYQFIVGLKQKLIFV